MRPPVPSRLRPLAILSLLFLGGAVVVLLVLLDRSSLERGNRMYRAGEIESAAGLFESRASRASAGAAEIYNAGTAELTLGRAGAAPHLLRAADSPDSLIAQRANYNLGYHYLTSFREDLEVDSAVVLLEAAIDHSRAALKLDPRLDDVRWNLALAQMRLDSVTQIRTENRNRSLPGTDETPIDLDALARGLGEAQSGIEPENARASEVLGQRTAAAQGAREAWAYQDSGPVSAQEARLLLEQIDHDPVLLIRGLMWSHRPDVAWWNSEPYPGGNW